MKKLMTLMLGLCLALSPLAVTFARDAPADTEKDKGKGKGKADPKKKGGKPQDEASKKSK